MKLFNVIVIHDVYVAAESPEDARETIKKWLKTDEAKPTEETALETRNEGNIRMSWREQKPFVGDAVPDKDFSRLKGKNVVETFKMLYTK